MQTIQVPLKSILKYLTSIFLATEFASFVAGKIQVIEAMPGTQALGPLCLWQCFLQKWGEGGGGWGHCKPSLSAVCACIHLSKSFLLSRSLGFMEQIVQKHLEVWQRQSLCIIHPRMYRKCPKTWQAAWLMPLVGGNWMNKWYSLSFCNFFGGKIGQTLAKVRQRMI